MDVLAHVPSELDNGLDELWVAVDHLLIAMLVVGFLDVVASVVHPCCACVPACAFELVHLGVHLRIIFLRHDLRYSFHAVLYRHLLQSLKHPVLQHDVALKVFLEILQVYRR